MKLSELNPEDVQPVSDAPAAAAPLRLSHLDPGDVQLLSHEDPDATSPVTAATTGAIQGASMGWGPAIGAGVKTGMDAITGTNGPLAGGSIDDLVDEYRRQRDELRGNFSKAAAAHPHIAMAGNLAGGMATLGAAGPAAMTTKGLGTTGALMGAGGVDINKASDVPNVALAAGEGAATNIVGGKVMEAAAPYIGKALAPVGNALSSGAKAVGGWLGDHAENLAEAATGATRAQAEKYAEGTGRELLDRKIVNFGDSPADIAANANKAMDAAEASKSDIVQNQLQGTNVDRNTVYNYLQKKIDELAGNESQIDLVNKLKAKQDDILGMADQTASEVPLAKSEEIRRGFDKSAKWNSNSDAATLEANKITANGYREAGENAATATNPELGAQFKADKTTQAKLIPVADAAEKRALQLQQSPHAGLMTAAHAGVGASIGTAIGGPPGTAIGMAAGMGVKALRPRFASMGAVSADQISKLVSASPHVFGKFAGVLQSAAARGSTSLGATDYILQQTNPAYREQRERVFNPSGEDQEPQVISDAEKPHE